MQALSSSNLCSGPLMGSAAGNGAASPNPSAGGSSTITDLFHNSTNGAHSSAAAASVHSANVSNGASPDAIKARMLEEKLSALLAELQTLNRALQTTKSNFIKLTNSMPVEVFQCADKFLKNIPVLYLVHGVKILFPESVNTKFIKTFMAALEGTPVVTIMNMNVRDKGCLITHDTTCRVNLEKVTAGCTITDNQGNVIRVPHSIAEPLDIRLNLDGTYSLINVYQEPDQVVTPTAAAGSGAASGAAGASAGKPAIAASKPNKKENF